MGMIPPGLKHGQKAYISYTGLDGLEKGMVVELNWLKNINRRVKRKLVVIDSFPYVKIESIYYTDVVLDSGCQLQPDLKHIYALESPTAMARKFWINYTGDTTAELIQDQLEHGNR